MRETWEGGSFGREPERSESPREQEVPTRTKPSGSEEGHGFSGGRKTLRRRYEAGKVSWESARAERWTGNGSPTPGEEESSEGRSPRVLGAERGFRGNGDGGHREGSQTLRVRLPRPEATGGGRSSE